MSEHAEKKTDVGARMSRWFREMKSELKKVVWPTVPQVVNNTGIVLAAIFIVGIVVWVLDIALGTGIRYVINR